VQYGVNLLSQIIDETMIMTDDLDRYVSELLARTQIPIYLYLFNLDISNRCIMTGCLEIVISDGLQYGHYQTDSKYLWI